MLLVSRESISHLDQLLENKGTTGNFRANLIVQGASAHAEDRWDTLQTENGLKFEITRPCARCSVVNVDGKTGSIDGSTLKTLATYRRDSGQIYFGQFLRIQSFPELSIMQGNLQVESMLSVIDK